MKPLDTKKMENVEKWIKGTHKKANKGCMNGCSFIGLLLILGILLLLIKVL